MGLLLLLTKKLGIDAKVASGLATKAATMLLGPVGSAIIVFKLDGEIQGIYYLFLSIVALRSFFELGVGMSITQIAAHEKISTINQATVHPAMVLAANRWLKTVAFYFALLVGAGGAAFLISKGYTQFSILGAWCLFITVSALRFSFDGIWSMLTGADYVKEANNLLTILQILLYVIQWPLLLLGFGLYSFAISGFVIYIAQHLLVRRRYPWLFPRKGDTTEQEVADRRISLLNLLKRSSQTFMTGYFVFQIQQPICFHLLGATSSAKLGFTQIVGMAFLSLPVIWVQSSFPSVASSVANGDIEAAWQRYRSALVRTASLTALCLFAAMAAAECLRLIPRFSERLMSGSESSIFFVGLSLQTLATSLTYWPRSFKVEPFVTIAYVQMFTTPILLWGLISQWELTGVGLATIGSWIIGLIGIILISKRFLPNHSHA
jgi:hypothetical protein